MPLSLLSRFREPLMGFAILWVVAYHSLYAIPDVFPFSVLHFLHRTGYGGVDIFFLLSGMGLAFGWTRRPLSPLAFWKRRLLRLLPTFWIGTLGWTLTRPLRGLEILPSPRALFEAFSGIGFWTGGDSPFWFLSAIVACYLAFPFLAHRLWDGSHLYRKPWLLLQIASMLLACVLALCPVDHSLLIFFVRLPIFLLGMAVGFCLNEANAAPRLPPWLGGLLTLAGAVFLWMVFWHLDSDFNRERGLWWFPFWLLTMPLALLLASLFAKLSGHARVLLVPLSWAGRRSLELYVCHTVLFSTFPDGDNQPRWFFTALSEPARLPEYLAYFAFAALAAEALGRLQARLISR